MLEMIAIAIAIFLLILFSIVLLWKFTFSGMLRTALFTFFGILHKRDKSIDPEAPIYPSEESRISDIMREQANLHKGGIALSHEVPQAVIPAKVSSNQVKYEPPYTKNPVTIGEDPVISVQAENPVVDVIVSPPQPLVEDKTFNRDDPIIDNQYIDPSTPSADTLSANGPKLDSSPFGVRSAPHSPGRRLRDKRSNRNSS